jgi:thioredoxin 1
MEIIHLEKQENFKDLINEDKILIDFFATWCGPCKMLANVLENVESDIKVLKVDTDEFENLAREYKIMSIPTLILFKDGIEVKKNIGFIDEEGLERFLK